MTATLDGTPWISVSTIASVSTDGRVLLDGTDCSHVVHIQVIRFRGIGTYEIATSDLSGELRCDPTAGPWCGLWMAGRGIGSPEVYGSGSVTVTAYTAPTPGVDGSGAIEGVFSFTLVPNPFTPNPVLSPIGARTLTNGRFGTRFLG